MQDEDAFERAAERELAERRRRRGKRYRMGFRIHLRVYVAVQALLVVIWAVTATASGDWTPWFVYPLLGWGIGVVAHYSAVRPRSRQAASGESISS